MIRRLDPTAPRQLPSGDVAPTPSSGAAEKRLSYAIRAWRVAGSDDARSAMLAQARSIALGEGGPAADPFATLADSACAFHLAARSGSVELLDLMAELGGGGHLEFINEADACGLDSAKSGIGLTVLAECWRGAMDQGVSAEPMVRRLVELGAHVDGCSKNPGGPLHMHVWSGDVAAVEALLQSGADLSLTPFMAHEGTMLHFAMKSRRASPEMHDLLLAHGADPSVLDRDGLTAYLAAETPKAAWILALFEKAALGQLSRRLLREAADPKRI